MRGTSKRPRSTAPDGHDHRRRRAALAGGRADTSLYPQASVDFTPELSHGSIAAITLGVMLGLAALTVFSLLWMALRVRWRGAYGRKASAALRSLYPVVLGLGGWLLGLLIVLPTMPGVALDDELLAVLSVGVPIGLGIYFAWVIRDWSAATRTMGLAAAVAGALVGGWLGFSATEGLVAVLLTIVGAAAGSNLMLIALDMTSERSIGSRVALDAEASGFCREPSRWCRLTRVQAGASPSKPGEERSAGLRRFRPTPRDRCPACAARRPPLCASGLCRERRAA